MTKRRRRQMMFPPPSADGSADGGVDPVDGPVMFKTDPDGSFTKYSACAIGEAREGANGMLRDKYNKDMTLKETVTPALWFCGRA